MMYDGEGFGNHRWAYLPNLPARNASTEHPGIIQDLGVTAQGNLLAVGIGDGASLPLTPDGSIGPQPVPLYVWVWDRAHQRWEYLPHGDPAARAAILQRMLRESTGAQPIAGRQGDGNLSVPARMVRCHCERLAPLHS
jgi:hypothetical protein